MKQRPKFRIGVTVTQTEKSQVESLAQDLQGTIDDSYLYDTFTLIVFAFPTAIARQDFKTRRAYIRVDVGP